MNAFESLPSWFMPALGILITIGIIVWICWWSLLYGPGYIDNGVKAKK